MTDKDESILLVSSDPPVIPGNSSRVTSTKGKSKCVKDDSLRTKSKRQRGSDYKCVKVDEPIGLASKLRRTIEEVFTCLDLYKLLIVIFIWPLQTSIQIVEIANEEHLKVKKLEERLAEQDRSFQQREDVLRRSFEALISEMETENETRDEVFLKLLSGREEMRERHDTGMEMSKMESDADLSLAVLQAK